MDINHILKLARIEISLEEKKNLEKDLSSILHFVEVLEEVNMLKEKQMINAAVSQNVMREDTEEKMKDRNIIAKKLLELAPRTKNGYVKVKQILQ